MAIFKYKPNEVVVTVAGLIIEDLAQDGFITIEFDDDKITKTIDVNGGGGFNISASRAGAITLSLLHGSKWLGVFTDYVYANKTLPILIQDGNGYDNKIKAGCLEAMIRQTPVYEFGAETSEVEVVFDCVRLDVGSLPVGNVPGVSI